MAFLVKFFPFILAWMLVKCSIRKDKIVFLQKSSGENDKLLLVMTWTENEEVMRAGCEIFTDEEMINETIAFNDSQIRTLSKDEMQALLGDCVEFNHQRTKRDTDNTERTGFSTDDIEYDIDELSRTNRRTSGRRRGSRNRATNRNRNGPRSRRNGTTTVAYNEIEDEYDKFSKDSGLSNKTLSNSDLEKPFDTNKTTTEPPTTLGYNGLPIIYPGTKWCGAGAMAEHYDDLGMYEDTDKCCRAHDLCNDTLAPRETRNGLTNTSPFTKLCCRCDEEFYDCLDSVDSMTSNSIGNMYFNLLRRDCYTLDHPPTETCKKYLTIFKLTCLEYEKDTSEEKVYQWSKTKRYTRF